MTYPTGVPSVQECLASVIVKEKPSRTTVPPTFVPDPSVKELGLGDALRLEVADQLEDPDHEGTGLAGERGGVGRVVEMVVRKEQKLRLLHLLRPGGRGRIPLEPRVDQNGLAGGIPEGKAGMAEPADLDGRHREPPVRKGADGSFFPPFIQGARAARKGRKDAFLSPPRRVTKKPSVASQ